MNSVSVKQCGAALQIAVPAAAVPVVLEFSGESLVALLMAAQKACWAREKPEHRHRGERVTKLSMGAE